MSTSSAVAVGGPGATRRRRPLARRHRRTHRWSAECCSASRRVRQVVRCGWAARLRRETSRTRSRDTRARMHRAACFQSARKHSAHRVPVPGFAWRKAQLTHSRDGFGDGLRKAFDMELGRFLALRGWVRRRAGIADCVWFEQFGRAGDERRCDALRACPRRHHGGRRRSLHCARPADAEVDRAPSRRLSRRPAP